MSDDNIDIRIELPLPIDITSTLINVIGKTYPGAVIKDDGNSKGWRSENRLVLSIPQADRHKSAKKAEKYAKVKAHLEAESEAFISELDPNAFSLGLPAWLADQFVAIAKVWHAQYPEDTNYLESTLREKDSNQEWVFYVAKAKDRTPHALREKAEARAKELETQVEVLREEIADLRTVVTKCENQEIELNELKRQLEAVPWQYVPKDMYDRALEESEIQG